MKKIILFLLVFSLFVNNAFADDYSAFLYKDNVLKIGKGETLLNGKSFSGQILVGEDGKILHTILTEGKIIKLDGEKLDIESNNRINFLENGGYLVFGSNDTKGKDSFITYNGSTDDLNTDPSKYLIQTVIGSINNKSLLGGNKYFIYNNKFIKLLGVRNYVTFIDTEMKDLVYDVTCKNNYLSFYYKGKEVINTNGIDTNLITVISFPDKRHFGVDTKLNINGTQYLLTNNVIGFLGCNISISSEPKLDKNLSKVENSDIINDVKISNIQNEGVTEIVMGGYKLKNIYIVEGVYYVNGIRYYFNTKINKIELLSNGDNILSVINLGNDEALLYKNIEFIGKIKISEFKLELKSKYSDYGKIKNPDLITLDEYKKLLENTKEFIVIDPFKNINQSSKTNITKPTNLPLKNQLKLIGITADNLNGFSKEKLQELSKKVSKSITSQLLNKNISKDQNQTTINELTKLKQAINDKIKSMK